MITLDLSGAAAFVNIAAADETNLRTVRDALASSDMSGFNDLPRNFTPEPMLRAAGRIRETADTLVVCGAGGSSLGARALVGLFAKRGAPRVLFAGDNLSAISMSRLAESLDGSDFAVVVSSKSGTTTETLAAFRVMYGLLTGRHGSAAARERVFVVTEPKPSGLRRFAEENNCAVFDIPLNVGGRFSVFTPANLLPAAVAGADIGALVSGAVMTEGAFADAVAFAAVRNRLYAAGFTTELFASFEPVMEQFGLWWRQLFGESEGKHGGGVFPATVTYTSDLHSMGQYVQDGRRDLFETVVSFTEPGASFTVSPPVFDDGLTYLTGRAFAEINDLARAAVKNAHTAGGVPVAEIRAASFNERSVGALMQFFMTACAASCFLRGVNPFDQPGVEAYKSQMKRLLSANG